MAAFRGHGWQICLATLLLIGSVIAQSKVGELSAPEIEDALQVNVEHRL